MRKPIVYVEMLVEMGSIVVVVRSDLALAKYALLSCVAVLNIPFFIKILNATPHQNLGCTRTTKVE